MEFKNQILQIFHQTFKNDESVLAVWEGGSAANSTSDEYSDLDLNILASRNDEAIFKRIEEALGAVSEITSVWNEPKSIWPDLTQKVYFLKDSPKHFFVDVAVFPQSSPQILSEFMQPERHGKPVILFDKANFIQTQNSDKAALLQRQALRLKQVSEAFPVFRTEVFKELDRHHAIDAFGFYQSAMLRPLIEILGMIHRPHRFDFGLRYLQQSFPQALYEKLEKLTFVQDIENLRACAIEVDKMFHEAVAEVKAKLSEIPSVDKN